MEQTASVPDRSTSDPIGGIVEPMLLGLLLVLLATIIQAAIQALRDYFNSKKKP